MQAPLSNCQLCEEARTVSWRCLDCNKVLCQSCKISHSNIDTELEHRIVSMKDVRNIPQKTDAKIKLKGIRCSMHDDKPYSNHCVGCDVLVCPKCLTDSHQMHRLQSIDDLYRKKLESLQQIKDVINHKLLTFFARESNILDNIRHLQETKNLEMKNKIKQQQAKLIKEISEQTQLLLDEFETYTTNVVTHIQFKKVGVHGVCSYLTRLRCEIDEVRLSNNIQEVCQVTNEVSKKINDVTTSLVSPSLLRYETFCEEDITKQSVRFSLGSVEAKSFPEPIDFAPFEYYNCGLTSVSSITVNKTGDIWITDAYSDSCHRSCKSAISAKKCVVKKIAVGFGGMKMFKNTECHNVTDIAAMGDELVISCDDKPSIKKITVAGDMVDFYTFRAGLWLWFSQPQIPVSLHVTNDYEIVVGTMKLSPEMNSNSEFYMTFMGLLILSQQGKLLRSIGGKETVTYPRKITSNINGQIIIIDQHHSEGYGNIVALSREGTIKWKYTGGPSMSIPGDVATTQQGNIVVCDKFWSLHILNIDGQLIKRYLATDLGINLPVSIAVQQNGKLLIGNKKTLNNNTAGLYVFKFQGF